MTFSAIMANSLSGLSAASLRAEILSFNIANANTDGYARRNVTFAAVQPGGVRAVGVERADAGRTELRLLGAQTGQGGADVRAEALKEINEAFGEPGDQNGLYATFARFEQALADLRLTPESGSTQLAFLRAAEEVTTTFQRLDTEAQAQRLSADNAIAAKVGRLNDAIIDRVDALDRIARDNGFDVLDLAVSWLAGREGVSSVIAGARTPEQAVRNARSANWQMKEADRAAIEAVLKSRT